MFESNNYRIIIKKDGGRKYYRQYGEVKRGFSSLYCSYKWVEQTAEEAKEFVDWFFNTNETGGSVSILGEKEDAKS